MKSLLNLCDCWKSEDDLLTFSKSKCQVYEFFFNIMVPLINPLTTGIMYSCHVHLLFSVLILITHTGLQKCLVTKDAMTKPTLSDLSYTMNFQNGKFLFLSLLIIITIILIIIIMVMTIIILEKITF